ncbi:unnamed protein product [Schistocephalus solidus]|uniref:CBS domain-containing protein n=1 Tax=Schistocephalus solidus TaxID=70667 RepID=A0A183SN52_SCHSO|nr:unnamed protein product [Schistocephalus solidus]
MCNNRPQFKKVTKFVTPLVLYVLPPLPKKTMFKIFPLYRLNPSTSLADTNQAYRIFLKHHTCYDLVPLSAKLIVFDHIPSLPVCKGFFALVYNGVRVAILWDSETQSHVGLLTITDFIRILHKYYKSPDSPMLELEQHQIKTWREQMSDNNRPFIYITPERTLLDAVRTLLKNNVHRLPIMDPVTGNPLHILTHKRLLKYLHFNMSKLPTPSFMNERLRDLPLGTMRDVVCVRTDWPLHRVLQVFIDHRVSALPVIEDSGCMVDIYAKFDVIVSKFVCLLDWWFHLLSLRPKAHTDCFCTDAEPL